MRISTIISSTIRQLTPELLQDLHDVYPEGRGPNGFTFEAVGTHSTVLDKLQQVFHAHGYQPPPVVGSAYPKEYWLAHKRQYEIADFQSARLLVPMGAWDSTLGMQTKRDNQGHLLIPLTYFHKMRVVDFLAIGRLVASADMRQAIEAAGLQGMVFREAHPKRGKSAVQPGRLWEVSSNVTMPPLSPVCELYDKEGRRMPRGSRTVYKFREGFYQPAEFHYLAGDLEKMAPFDFALTYEGIGSHQPAKHSLIVSQRFYQLCVAQGLELYWIPVRIDPR